MVKRRKRVGKDVLKNKIIMKNYFNIQPWYIKKEPNEFLSFHNAVFSKIHITNYHNLRVLFHFLGFKLEFLGARMKVRVGKENILFLS